MVTTRYSPFMLTAVTGKASKANLDNIFVVCFLD